MSNNFRSLLSEFCDATSSSSSASGGAIQKKASLNNPLTAASASVCSVAATPSTAVEPTSTTDPSFSAPLLKERVERIMRIRQIRQSTSCNKKVDADGYEVDSHLQSINSTSTSVAHIAICATIVDDFPHEALWKEWMIETGGEFSFEDNIPRAGGDDVDRDTRLFASAEMYVHAKNPERIQSEWLRSKQIPISHRPNWNDVRIVRAILSLLENALRNEKTTHVLLCTESCIPVATLKETARSVLLNEICPWEEAEEGTDGHHQQKECPSNRPKKNLPRGRLYWNQSYVDCYDRNSSRCTRFDEHNCWGMLRNSLPEEVVYKALPGWCLLSRKHAHDIVNIPTQLEGMNLWPAFERVWAPEEVFLPTALAICGNMEEVSRRALTYCHWDTRASNQKDRAHPICYDGYFDDTLVSRARDNGCLFLRKMKRPLNLSVWEQIVVHRKRGGDDAEATISSSERDMRTNDRSWDAGIESSNGRGGYNLHDSLEVRGPPKDRAASDSRRSYKSSNRHEDYSQRRKREFGSHTNYDDSRKRSHWRR